MHNTCVFFSKSQKHCSQGVIDFLRYIIKHTLKNTQPEKKNFENDKEIFHSNLL